MAAGPGPLHASLAVVLFACSATPAPAPAPSAPVVPPDPPVTTATAAPEAAARPPPGPDEGAPPRPPMAMIWSFRLLPFAGQPGRVEHLAVSEKGEASFASQRGGGDADLDEELSTARSPAPEVERCHGHLDSALHRRLVHAARTTLASGCALPRGTDRLGRPADAATTTIKVTWDGEVKSCEVGRSGGTYAAFEQIRSEAVAALCARR